jgi:uncharacterized protein
MKYTETALTFQCSASAESLVGIIAVPEAAFRTGVLVVVGGPQYRVGSHRQFVLLSRALAEAGYPVMRFDYRGMGDSGGEMRGFEYVTEDISAAIRRFREACPQLDQVVLWGLCDAASASLLYWDATHDPLVKGLVLLNPWIRTEAGLAKTHLKHYYGQRLFQADFWRKLLTGKLSIGRAIAGLIGSVKNARQQCNEPSPDQTSSFQIRMARGLNAFSGKVLILLSGDDYTAKEFLEISKADPTWVRCLKFANIVQTEISEADHTFSSAEWRAQVENLTKQWLDVRVKP